MNLKIQLISDLYELAQFINLQSVVINKINLCFN